MKPKYEAVASFLVREEKANSPLDNWGALAEQFGYKLRPESDPLLNLLDVVLKTESFYEPFLDRSIVPGNQDSTLAKIFHVDTLPPDEKLEAFTARVGKTFKLRIEEGKMHTLTVSTRHANVSQFLANGIIEGLNRFFRERETKDQGRKLEFLKAELERTRREMDSASNSVRIFLEANKEFSSPMLSYRYQRLKRDEVIYNEKFMITMKAYQSMNIASSQPKYHFEEFQRAKLARSPSSPKKARLIAIGFAGSLFLGAMLVIFFRWFLIVRRPAKA
jgi:uncharacterized protein involved in exopolysaccharide biosynthesis